MKIGGILKVKSASSKIKVRAILKDKAKRKKAILYGIGGFLLLIVLLFAWNLKDLPTPSKLAKLHASESTRIMDRNGNILYETGEQRRTVIDKNQIPQIVKNATVSAEDATFYQHSGIDLKGIARAAINDILNLHLAQGGSTITQQFVKNAILTDQKTFTRKIKEAILSIEIEQLYSKDDILAMYLNEIPYGGNTYGIQGAAQQYFGKDAKDLTLSEAATLAAVPRAPTYYSPYGTHTDDLFARKNYVLDRMSELGYISKDDSAKAKTETPTKDNPAFQQKKDSINAPYFVMYVKQKLVDLYGEKVVNSGGLQVTTSLDSDKQKAAEQAIADGTKKITRYGATNAAMVSVDTKTGEILDMVGGKDYFDLQHSGNVNVTDSQRQPGSSFKPIVYATAFKQGYSPSSILFDLSTDFNGYKPQNYDGTTHGAVTMRTALSNSLNIPAVKTLSLVSIPEALKTAKDLGITTLTQPDRYGLSLVLGGAEVKPIEMAGAFASFSDSGNFHEPTSILKVQDRDGKVLYEYKSETNKFQAVDPQVAYEITNILDDDATRRMVFGTNNALDFGDQHVAVKTGTTSNFHDAWTVGYSQDVATAVWVGNNDNTAMGKGADGSVVAAPIFHQFMAKYAKTDDFARPDGIQQLTVEKYSNKLPSQYSKEFNKDIFASWQVPTTRDNINVVLQVNKVNNKLATDQTPPELVEDKLFTNLHNEWGTKWKDYPNWEGPVRAWAEGNGMLLPPYEKDNSYTSRPQISFVNPTNQTTISATVQTSVTVSSEQPISSVDYYLDSAQIGTNSSNPYSISFDTNKYANSSHKLTARLTDSNGVTAETSVTITISNENAPKISAITASNSGAGKTSISFATDVICDSKIYYGTDANNMTSNVLSGTSTKTHSSTLNGLTSGQKYYFRITVMTPTGTSATADGSFTAA